LDLAAEVTRGVMVIFGGVESERYSRGFVWDAEKRVVVSSAGPIENNCFTYSQGSSGDPQVNSAPKSAP